MSQALSGILTSFSGPEHFINAIDDELPNLLKWIKENVKSGAILSQSVNFIFGQDSLLKHISTQSLENTLLKPTLITLNEIFSSSLKSIFQIVSNSEGYLEDIFFNLSELLQICLAILGGYNDILEHVQNVSHFMSKDVESLIRTLPVILQEAFDHCHESEKFYGPYFTSASELLSSLFRKSYSISLLLYKVLEEHIIFNCSIENDLVLLVTALETSCSIGEIVVNLDIKSLVEQWKGLAKLLTKYSVYLKERVDLSQPVRFLISCLQKFILAVSVNQEEDKIKSRNLKLGSFVLKIIVKLCELYCGYLDSCIYDLLKLILLLNRCTRLSKNESSEDLERFIVVGAGPLLSYLSKDRQFIEVFQNLANDCSLNSTEEIIGLLYTHLRLFQFLINSTDSEVKEIWLKYPLVQSAINLFSKCSSSLDLTTTIDGNDSYTTLVSVTVAFVISNFGTEQFIILEKDLFTQLLGPNFAVAILASDILTLLSRFTNETVCLKQTKYLFTILSHVSSFSHRPEASVIRTTAARLFSLLSRGGQESIIKEFTLFPHVWRHTQLASDERLPSINSLFNSVDISSPRDFVEMIEDLHMRCKSISRNTTLTTGSLCEIFRKLLMGLQTYSKFSKERGDWWCNVLYLVMKSAEHIIPLLDDKNLEEIFCSFHELICDGHPSVSYYISGALTKLLDKSQLPSIIVFNEIIPLIKLCFPCSNILIRLIIVERFTSILNVYDPELLQQIDDKVRNYSPEYLGSNVYNALNYPSSSSIDFIHNCYIIDYNNVISPPCKKFKSIDVAPVISDEIQKLLEVVDNVILSVKTTPLSDSDRQVVHKIICSLENL